VGLSSSSFGAQTLSKSQITYNYKPWLNNFAKSLMQLSNVSNCLSGLNVVEGLGEKEKENLAGMHPGNAEFIGATG